MKILRVLAVWLICNAGLGAWAEEAFSRAVPPEDFAAAGLGKLSAEELTKLDALVQRYQSGQLAAARRAAQAEAEAKAAQELKLAQAAAEAKAAEAVKAAQAEAAAAKAEVARSAAAKPAREAKSGGESNSAKVKLKPGTEIEYERVEAELADVFKGFDPGTVFTLTNGQRWQVVSGSYVCGPKPAVRKVRIEPGVLGSFFMEFEGVSVSPKVKWVGRK